MDSGTVAGATVGTLAPLFLRQVSYAGGMQRGSVEPRGNVTRRRRRLLAGRRAAAGVLVICVVAGCGSSGRELRIPPGVVAEQARYVALNQSEGPGGMLVEGPDFEPGGELPAEAVRAQLIPTLGWWNIPAATTELVMLITVFDPTEQPILWAAAGLGPSSAGLFAGPLPQGVRELGRADGAVDWPGYPPPGTRVVFTLCALATPLSPDAGAVSAWNVCGTEPVGVATVSGLVPALDQ